MKRGFVILALVLAAGFLAFCAMRMHRSSAPQGVLLDSVPELAWIKSELELSHAQFAKVAALHAAYRPRCVEMCREVEEARHRMEAAARSSRGMTPALEAAIKEHADVDARCRQAMVAHLYEIAAALEPDQAARYLDAMLPFALGSAEGESHSR